MGFKGGLGRLALLSVVFLLLLLFASARIFALTVICFSWKPSEWGIPEMGLFFGVSEGLTPLLLEAQQPILSQCLS